MEGYVWVFVNECVINDQGMIDRLIFKLWEQKTHIYKMVLKIKRHYHTASHLQVYVYDEMEKQQRVTSRVRILGGVETTK